MLVMGGWIQDGETLETFGASVGSSSVAWTALQLGAKMATHALSHDGRY
jgi:hypothetical protein